MPEAICKSGHRAHWRNQVSVRLKDLRCMACGGQLRRLTWEEAHALEAATAGEANTTTHKSEQA